MVEERQEWSHSCFLYCILKIILRSSSWRKSSWKKLSFSMLLVNFTNHDYLLVVKRQLNLWKINWKKKKTFQKTRILLVPQVLVPLPVPLSGILRSKLWQAQKSFRCLMSFPTTAPKTPAEIKVNFSLLCSKIIAVFFVWKHQMWICY